jgi:hypothetical protein
MSKLKYFVLIMALALIGFGSAEAGVSFTIGKGDFYV